MHAVVVVVGHTHTKTCREFYSLPMIFEELLVSFNADCEF